jgi:hypothetical protein
MCHSISPATILQQSIICIKQLQKWRENFSSGRAGEIRSSSRRLALRANLREEDRKHTTLPPANLDAIG